jgi:hypothetical protein
LERSVALYSTYKSPPSSKENMSGYLRTIFSFFTPKFVSADSESLAERILNKEVIKTINECGELRYIEVSKELGHTKERLDVLATKCENLHSFVTRMESHGKMSETKLKIFYTEMFRLRLKVRDGRIYGAKAQLIDDLTDEYETLEKLMKGSTSKSFRDLSSATRL